MKMLSSRGALAALLSLLLAFPLFAAAVGFDADVGGKGIVGMVFKKLCEIQAMGGVRLVNPTKCAPPAPPPTPPAPPPAPPSPTPTPSPEPTPPAPPPPSPTPTPTPEPTPPPPSPVPPPEPPPPPPPPPPTPADVVINEIAWMGSMVDGVAQTNAEWIELRNLGETSADLTGWTLSAEDGSPAITISAACADTHIAAGGLYLLVRTNNPTISTPANCTYSGGVGVNSLENGGELLELRNAAAELVDSVDGSTNWEIGGAPQKGTNATKDTAQRQSDGSWATAAPTPGF